ncbi:MAG: SpoIID/LytB domain-containing protein [Vicinamibacterales bacterium]
MSIRQNVLTLLLAGLIGVSVGAQRPAGQAWLIRSFDNPADSREVRSDILDTPVLPGSIAKVITLVAALESHVIEPDSTRICRRTVTVDGHRYVCSHPDLKRPLTPAEALAHSCNDFFVSLAQRLPSTAINDVRARVGLSAIPPAADFAGALVGLDGPKTTPRALLSSVARLVGADRARPFTMREGTRRVLLDGLRGAATYGSASDLGAGGIQALAKTGTASMPGGGQLGVLVAFTPAANPRRGAIVLAPGAAGRDAASIAADLLKAEGQTIRLGSPGSESRASVRAVALEDYVARVVAGEGPPDAPAAAQEALAVAVRTFALANRGRHQSEGFDLCDTTHCQVPRSATPASTRAAAATAGRVLLHDGKPAPIFYSASCGGYSARPSDVWPGATDHPFLPAQRDGACGVEPEWTSRVGASDIERALRAAGLSGTTLRGLRVAKRSASGRVMTMQVDGFAPAEISGEDFRLALGRTGGWQLLKSTAFELRRDARGYAFTGRGFGHGVGLCLSGAVCRAAAGASAANILSFYYPGLRLGEYRDDAAPSGGTSDVLLSLPGPEEGERALVTELVRRARDEIAARAHVPAPTAIRVTVHPDVRSFGRASRQPWFVAGATRGINIDLLPVTVLRQRGVLERTLRHEVAHVVVDSQLAGRALWVREGAASYFAEPLRDVGKAVGKAAGTCPSDRELTNPPSGDALRDAYLRAAACFRLQVTSGRRWAEVR